VRLLAESVELGLDILSEIIWGPALRPEDLEAERQVILEEILMHGDEPAEEVHDVFNSAMYPGHPLGRDVLGLLDSLRVDRVDFCGLSMGGMIGMWLAVHAPSRLHRLVLANTAARIGTKEMWNARIATARRDGMKPVAAAVIDRWFTPEFRASSRGSSAEKVARAQRMLENSPPEGYAACCAAIRDMDQRETIAQINAPTLVIYGRRDPVTPEADAQFLIDRIRGAVKIELAAAHLSNVEQADAFTEAVSNFLTR